MTFKRSLRNFRTLWKNKAYRSSMAMAAVLWVVSYIIYRISISYVDGLKNLKPVGDLLLDALPVIDLRVIYIFGILLVMGVLLCYVAFYRPDLFPFALKFFAIVFVVRAVFITLTHFGPPEGFFLPTVAGDLNFWPVEHLLHSNDLFFSGHVAYPFMAALLTLHNKKFFVFFLICSVIMGATVLLMRIHYSIDVFAAYFIVYGLYHFSRRVFGKTDLAFQKLIS